MMVAEATRTGRPVGVTRDDVLWITAALATTWVAFVLPGAIVIGLCVPVILGLSRGVDWWMAAATLLSNAFICLGTLGIYQYLGVLAVEANQACLGMTLVNVFGLVVSRQLPRRQAEHQNLKTPAASFSVVALVAMALLAPQFADGIQLFQGDLARLAAVQSVNPYIGLAGGSLTIAAAWMQRKWTRETVALTVLLVAVSAGTGSRLLLICVVVGTFAYVRSHLTVRTVRGTVLVAAFVAVVFVAMYQVRTDVEVASAAEERFHFTTGPVKTISAVTGPGPVLASRNGQVVFKLLYENDERRPPQGFIGGNLLAGVGLAVNPELWTTTALGFSVSEVGAVATPVWAGLFLDGGWPALICGSVFFGLAYLFLRDRSPAAARWLLLGLVFSSYGSYLLSTQFLLALLLIYLLTPRRIGASDLGKTPLSNRASAEKIAG